MSGLKKDFFRDTWVRYLGYANEVGESFRAVVPVKVVRASYGVAFAYVLADTTDKSWKMFRKDSSPKKVLRETGDALIWQTMASVIIPGFTINRICVMSQHVLEKYTKLPLKLRKGFIVGIGLASIPVIIHPIDNGVTYLMNMTYRKWLE